MDSSHPQGRKIVQDTNKAIKLSKIDKHSLWVNKGKFESYCWPVFDEIIFLSYTWRMALRALTLDKLTKKQYRRKNSAKVIRYGKPGKIWFVYYMMRWSLNFSILQYSSFYILSYCLPVGWVVGRPLVGWLLVWTIPTPPAAFYDL